MSATGGSGSVGKIDIAINTVYNNRGIVRAQKDITALKGATTGVVSGADVMASRFETAGQKMSTVGRQMSIGLTAPMVLFGAKSFKAAHEFQRSMDRIVSLAGIGRKQVDAMIEPALRLASEYGKMGEEAADALYFIASSGFNAKDSMKVLESSMMASATGMGELKEVADLLTSGINAYGKKNLSAASAVDIMAVAIREGKMESDEMAKTMGSLIPIAAELDIPFNDVAGVMAVMSRTGADAFKSATQLRGIMGALLKPSVQGAEALDKVGLSAAEVRNTITQKGLYAGLSLLRESLGDNKEALAKVFPNVRGLAGFLNVMGAQAGIAGKILKQTADAAGQGAKAFEAYKETRQFQYEQAIASLHNAMIDFGIAITPMIVTIAQKIADVISAFNNLPGPVKSAAGWFGAIVAVAGPLLYLLGGMANGISAVKNGYRALNGFLATNTALTRANAGATAASTAASSRLGLLLKGGLKAGAIGAAVAIGTGLVMALGKSVSEARKSEEANKATAEAIKKTGNAANVTVQSIADLSREISNKTGVDDEAIQSASNLLLQFKNIKNSADGNVKTFDRATKATVDLAAGLTKAAPTTRSLSASSKLLGSALNNPTKGLKLLSDAGVKFTQGQKEQIRQMVETGKMHQAQAAILGAVENKFKGAAASQTSAMDKLKASFTNFLETVGVKLIPYIDMATKWLSNFFTEMQNGTGTGGAVRDIIDDVGRALQAMVPLVIVGAQVIGWLVRQFANLPGPVKMAIWPIARIPAMISGGIAAFKFLKNVVSTAAGAIGGFVSKMAGKVKGIFGSMASFISGAARRGFLGPIPMIIANWGRIKSFFSQLPGRIGSMLGGLASIISTPFRVAASIISGLLNGIISAFNSAISTIKSAVSSVSSAIGAAKSAIPGFAAGGRIVPQLARGGKVATPTLYIAGDSAKAEWVISQTGDRKRNQGYIIEAAAALGIPMFGSGGKVGKQKDRPAKTKKEKLLYRNIATPNKVNRLETFLARAELSETNTDDISAVNKLIAMYTKSYQYLDKVFGGLWKTKDWKAAFGKDWRQKRKEFKDQRLSDIQNVKRYRDQLADLQGTTGVSSAQEQLIAFNQERLDLLTSFGSNIRARSTTMAPGGTSVASTGNASVSQRQAANNSSGNTNVNITQNYQKPPEDPHAWTRGVQNEITAIL